MYKYFLLLLAVGLFACDSSPKVIEAEPASGSGRTSAVDQALGGGGSAPSSTVSAENHQVTALESMNTNRYTYVRVKENNQEFWIAIPKSEIQIGATYYFQGGLLKKDFFSQEFNRTFETLYLVNGLSTQAAGGSAVDQALGGQAGAAANITPPSSVQAAQGAVKLGDLVKNKTKYNGKTVIVTGKVMKVNPMIMGRNWIHVQDGTGNNFDLTVTTKENVPPGHIVTFEGTLTLDKDFGAGYRYDLILEDAVLKK